MRCPQCQRENKFPVPGLCPDCYKQWKEEMRARYGPGPWPNQPVAARKGGQGTDFAGDTKQSVSEKQEASDSTASNIERSVTAVLDRLQEPDAESKDFLLQLDSFLREVARMVVQRCSSGSD